MSAEPVWYAETRVVGAADLDEQGRVNNVRWVQWVQDIAVAHSDAVGLSADTYRARGLLWVVREHHVTYHAPGLAHDELRVATAVIEGSAVTLTRATRIERAGVLLVEGRTLWCLLEAERQRPCRIPADVRAAYARVS